MYLDVAQTICRKYRFVDASRQAYNYISARPLGPTELCYRLCEHSPSV